MTRNRPKLTTTDALRRSRRALGNGTLGGRNVLATPYVPSQLGGNTVVGSGNGPRGETVALTGTVTVAGAGSSVVTSMDTIQAQSAFVSVDAAGDTVLLPVDAIYLAEVDVRWTDGYRGGGTVEVTVDGAAIGAVWDSDGPWSRWVDQVAFAASAGGSWDVKVTPDDGTQHGAEVTVRLSLLEKLRTVATASQPTGAYIAGFQYAGAGFTYEQVVWHLPQGSTTWDTVPVPAAIEPDQSQTAAAGCFCGDAIILVGSGGTFWRSTVTPPSAAGDWTEVLDSTTSGGILVEGDAIASDASLKVRALEQAAATPELWESDDSGATWALQRTFGVRYDFIAHNGFSTWVVMGSRTSGGGNDYGTLAISTDGDTWNTVTVPNDAPGRYAAAVDGSDDDVIVLAQTNMAATTSSPSTADCYLTLNGGSSWTAVDLSIGNASGDGTVQAYTDTQGRVCVVGTDNKVYVHEGSGTWSSGVALPAKTLDLEDAFVSVAADGQIAVVNNSDTADLSDDDGATWAQSTYDDDTVSGNQTGAAAVFRNGWKG